MTTHVRRVRVIHAFNERMDHLQRTRTWKESHNPDKDAKLDRIKYVHPDVPAANDDNAGAARDQRPRDQPVDVMWSPHSEVTAYVRSAGQEESTCSLASCSTETPSSS